MTGTWNPSDNNGLTFSNGNLTATNATGSGVWYTCRATPYFEPSNRVYAEFTATNVGVSDSAVYVAVMTGNAALNLPGLFDANSVGYNENGSTTYNGSGPTLATWTTGNTVCVAVDGGAGKVWWRVNNGNWMNDGSNLANPTSNVGGIACPNIFTQGPVYFGVSIHTVNYAVTANFNGTFTYSVPSGFGALPLVTATAGNPIFAAGNVGSLSNATAQQALTGLAGSARLGSLLPTTSAIFSVGSTGQSGSLVEISKLTLSGVAGQAAVTFGATAQATTIYNYEGFDHENAQIDLSLGILKNLVNCTAGISSNTPYGTGSSLALTVNGGAASTAGYCTYNTGPFAIQTASMGVMTQSNIFANIATDVGFMVGTNVQVFARMIGNTVYAYRGNPASPTLLGTFSNTIPATGWFYLEMTVVIAPANAGSLSIYVNGTQIANLTAVTTSATGSTLLDGILLGGVSPANANTTLYFDDIYMARSQLGTVRVSTVRPTGNGAATQFLPFSQISLNNWQEVNEVAMDFDSTYNASSTYLALDEFTVSSLPAGANGVIAVKVVMAARKDSVSVRPLGTLVLSNGVTASGVSNALTNLYQYYSDVYLVDPATNAAWTLNGVKNMQIGYQNR